MIVLAVAGAVMSFGVAPAAGQTSVNVESLSIADATTTAEDDVTDVRIDTTLGYNQSVPDATERVIKLRAGPSESDLKTLTFTRTESPADGAGTVDLSGSLTDAGFSASDFNPNAGATKETTVVVQAVIEIPRANGDPVTATATDTATVTIHDGAVIRASIGGSGELTVETGE